MFWASMVSRAPARAASATSARSRQAVTCSMRATCGGVMVGVCGASGGVVDGINPSATRADMGMDHPPP